MRVLGSMCVQCKAYGADSRIAVEKDRNGLPKDSTNSKRTQAAFVTAGA